MADKRSKGIEISEPTFLSPIDVQFRMASKNQYNYSYELATVFKTEDEYHAFNYRVGNKEKTLTRKK